GEGGGGRGVGGEALTVLVLDATQSDFAVEAQHYREWKAEGRNVLVFYNKMDAVRDGNAFGATLEPWAGGRVAFGSALDAGSLATEFIPRVMEALPEHQLSLARHYPLCRIAVARALINDTSFANASYALGTGLAEVIPALDIPFNVADVIILTKNQALMVYKLGLALGLSPRWQDHVTQLGGVVGASFVWRQVARQLVGLIPVWGIVPKVAVAYAGTYSVGQAVVYWYQTGHKISGAGMRQLYVDALARGRQVAQGLFQRAPRPALPKVTMPSLPRPRGKVVCSHCGKENPSDATYCAYCGKPLKS
ncbi:MAG: zinc-ribbon domain-containing protein, partial [Chloroflexi bacterium]|nr:zinc-ribbon domain-containing protein [Chloroflexota bacterium]